MHPYVAYTVYLLMTAANHTALADFRLTMQAMVRPLTVLTPTIVTWRNLKSRSKPIIPEMES